MTGLRRSLVIATAERYLGLLANFATLAVVSRLLTPDEIGVSVLGFAIVAMALAAREFATTIFLIQRKDLQLQDIRAAFTILLLVSMLIWAAMNLLAAPLARIYAHAGLEPFLRVVSISIVSESFTGLVTALLRRQMAFGRAAALNLGGAAVSLIVTLSAAALGFSYMSFAYGGLAGSCVSSAFAVAMSPSWAIFKPSLKAWRSMATFGGYNGTNVMMYRIYESMPYLVLGRIMSIDALALYNRSVTVCQIPEKIALGGLNSVLIAAFSEELRGGKGLHRLYLRSVELITCVHWPALVLLAILAEPAVLIVLGEQWLAAVPIVRIIAIALLGSFSAELNYPVLIAQGALRDLMTRSMITWPTSAVIIACASFFGLEAAALSWLIIIPFQSYISIRAVQRHVPVRWSELANALRKSAIVTLLSALGPLLIVAGTSASGTPLSLLLTAGAVALAGIGWFVGLRLVAHPLLHELGIVVATAAPFLGLRGWARRSAESLNEMKEPSSA